MTRPQGPDRIDQPATLQAGLQAFSKAQRERILRELRYMPGFSGQMTFVLKFKNGVPFAQQEAVEHNSLIPPVVY